VSNPEKQIQETYNRQYHYVNMTYKRRGRLFSCSSRKRKSSM